MTEKFGNYTAKELASKMEEGLGSLDLKIGSLTNIQGVISKMAAGAREKYVGEKQLYFLWDHNDSLQMVDDLMFRLMNEINEEQKQLSEMQSALFQKMKVGEMDDEKSLARA